MTRILLFIAAILRLGLLKVIESSGEPDPCECFKSKLNFTEITDEYTFRVPAGSCELYCQLTVDTALKPNATHKPGFKLFYKLDGMRRAVVPCTMLKVRPVGGPMSKLIVIDPRLFFDIPYRAFSLTHRWQDEGGFEWEKNEYDTDDYKMWITVRPYYFLKT